VPAWAAAETGCGCTPAPPLRRLACRSATRRSRWIFRSTTRSHSMPFQAYKSVLEPAKYGLEYKIEGALIIGGNVVSSLVNRR